MCDLAKCEFLSPTDCHADYMYIKGGLRPDTGGFSLYMTTRTATPAVNKKGIRFCAVDLEITLRLISVAGI